MPQLRSRTGDVANVQRRQNRAGGNEGGDRITARQQPGDHADQARLSDQRCLHTIDPTRDPTVSGRSAVATAVPQQQHGEEE